MTRTVKSFLGPFYNIVNYPDITLDQPDNTARQYSMPYSHPDYIVIDFDVRPQLVMLHRTLKTKFTMPIDWEVIESKTVASISRCIKDAVKVSVLPGVEGISSDGTLACTLVIEQPTVTMIRSAYTVIINRIKTQRWRYTQLENSDMISTHLRDMNLIPVPRQDRVAIDVLDRDNHRAIPMVAENFYATTDTNRTFPLYQWDVLATLMEENCARDPYSSGARSRS